MPFRVLFAVLLPAFAIAAGPDKPPASAPIPILPTRVTLDSQTGTLADALAAFRKAGFDVDGSTRDGKTPVAAVPANAPFWEALEAVAEQSGSRIELRDHGRKISLVKRDGTREPSCVRGPFRVAATQVTGRLDLATGHSFQEVQLEVHWEPRFPVFRIDSVPAVTLAKDDLGTSLEAASASALSPVTRASNHLMPVRLLGVPRKAQRIAELKGHFTVTASERMLPFTFKNPGGKGPVAGVLPPGLPAPNVQASLLSWQREELSGKSYWEATLKLTYPAKMPVFQSFETWLGENKLRLISPQGTTFAPDQVEEPEPGREMTAVYRFDAAKLGGTPQNWSLLYETPAPLVEFQVPFELRDVPLP